MFGPSSRKQCVQIPVTNDMVPEVPEHFSVVLSMTIPLAGVILTPENATVVISDDDGECSDSWRMLSKSDTMQYPHSDSGI